MRTPAWVTAVAVALLALAGCHSPQSDVGDPCVPPRAATAQPGEHVQMAMKDVHFRATKTVALEIEWLRGELLRTRPESPPDTEDPTSYVIRLDEARIRIREDAIANDFRDYVLAGTGAPIEALRVDAKDGRLRFRGRMTPGIPFDIEATVHLRKDGRLIVKTRRVRALGIGVRRLSERTGIGLSRIIGSHPERGVVVRGNDLIVDPRRAFPPPHLEGPLLDVRVVDGALALHFGRSPTLTAAGRAPLPPPGGTRYIQHHRGVLANGKTVTLFADQRLLDEDPSDPFDYSQPFFSRDQLPASRIEVSPRGETTVLHVPDFDDVSEIRRTRGRD